MQQKHVFSLLSHILSIYEKKKRGKGKDENNHESKSHRMLSTLDLAYPYNAFVLTLPRTSSRRSGADEKIVCSPRLGREKRREEKRREEKRREEKRREEKWRERVRERESERESQRESQRERVREREREREEEDGTDINAKNGKGRYHIWHMTHLHFYARCRLPQRSLSDS